MWKDSNRKRSTQRTWDRQNRPPRDRRAYYAAWKSRQDPNVRRERESEQRFRWRSPAPNWPLSIVHRLEHQRPTFFLLDSQGVLQQENWETPDELVARLLKKGVLIVPPKPKKTPQNPGLLIENYLASHGSQADVQVAFHVGDHAVTTFTLTRQEARVYFTERLAQRRALEQQTRDGFAQQTAQGQPIEAEWTAWLADHVAATDQIESECRAAQLL